MENENKICPDCETNILKTELEIQNNRCNRCNKRKRTCNELRVSRGLEPIPYVPLKFITNPSSIPEEENIIEEVMEDEPSKESEKIENKTALLTDKSLALFCQLLNKGVDSYPILWKVYNQICVDNDLHPIAYEKFTKQLKDNYIFSSNALAWKFKLEKEEELNSLIDNIELYKQKWLNIDLGNELQQIIDNFEWPNDIKEKLFMSEIVDSVINKSEIEPEVENKNTITNEQVENEVNSILDRKYNILKCNRFPKYKAEDYIKLFEMLKDLNENYYTYVNNLCKQYEIMNKYQLDILHEIENENIVEGDNYLQRKLKYLRALRRDSEYGLAYLNITKPYVLYTETKQFDPILKQLREERKRRLNPVYIPNVDMDSIEKYDWCIKASLNSKKTLNDPLLKEEVDKEYKLFNVITEVAGNNFGAFKTWKEEIQALNEQDAIAKALNKLEEIKKKNKSFYWSTPLRVIELRR